MTDAPAFHDYAQKALAELRERFVREISLGRAEDYADYKRAVGVIVGIDAASETLRATYKTVIEGVKTQKDDNAGRKPEDRRW